MRQEKTERGSSREETQRKEKDQKNEETVMTSTNNNNINDDDSDTSRLICSLKGVSFVLFPSSGCCPPGKNNTHHR